MSESFKYIKPGEPVGLTTKKLFFTPKGAGAINNYRGEVARDNRRSVEAIIASHSSYYIKANNPHVSPERLNELIEDGLQNLRISFKETFPNKKAAEAAFVVGFCKLHSQNKKVSFVFLCVLCG